MTKVPFPISIALIGAPGSGKSDTASAFKEVSRSFFAENASELDIITNPGNHLAEKFDKPMGRFGDYADNLWLHFSRHTLERMSIMEGRSIITCGTVLETLAYSGMNLQHLSEGVQTQHTQMQGARENATTAVLSALFMDTFRYTFGFYLPLPEKIYVPGSDIDSFPQKVDDTIKGVCSTFGVAVQALSGSPEERAQTMLETIQRIVENGVAEMPEEMAEAAEAPEDAGQSESIGSVSDTP